MDMKIIISSALISGFFPDLSDNPARTNQHIDKVDNPPFMAGFILEVTRSIVEVPIELQKHDILKVSQNKIWVLIL